MGQNDAAWEELFSRYHIPDAIERQGEFIITASQIKEAREPRLMTKFDHRVNLPEIFARNNLAILPITRGSYVIAPFAAYHSFETLEEEPVRVSVPAYLQSLAPQFLTSEAIALNCAGACGILRDFLGEEIVSTVSGRMGSGDFDFYIDTASGLRKVPVRHAQIEIDAAYEGMNSLSLLEAKGDLSEDFLIRQLYYPFRTWGNRVAKPVRTVFFVFSNGVFNLYEYRFENPLHYNSLRLVRQKSYKISTRISRRDVEDVLRTSPVEGEPEIPFPQANSMLRLINLMELLGEAGNMTAEEITTRYAFNRRQALYYTDAGRYLGVISRARGEKDFLFGLSRQGRYIMSLAYRERQLAITARIVRHRPFHEALRICLSRGAMPDTPELVRIMEGSGLYHVSSESTYARRASTVSSWISWVLNSIDGDLFI